MSEKNFSHEKEGEKSREKDPRTFQMLSGLLHGREEVQGIVHSDPVWIKKRSDGKIKVTISKDVSSWDYSYWGEPPADVLFPTSIVSPDGTREGSLFKKDMDDIARAFIENKQKGVGNSDVFKPGKPGEY